jgi:hypothetical protein
MSESKIRATILDISGMERYEIIKSAITRYNNAIEHNFFLEAIALIESLICDRLESRLGELKKVPITFNTIGNLLKELQKIEEEKVLIEIMNERINRWRVDRNYSIHQSAKIEYGRSKDWQSFLKQAELTAKEGRKIFDAYNAQLQKIRRKKK